MNYSMTFISPLVAEKFNQELPGCPTENRVLILSPKEVNQTKSGLIIPEQVKEGVPRKGIVVKSGEITEEYKTYRDWETDRKSTRLNSSYITRSRMPSSA